MLFSFVIFSQHVLCLFVFPTVLILKSTWCCLTLVKTQANKRVWLTGCQPWSFTNTMCHS